MGRTAAEKRGPKYSQEELVFVQDDGLLYKARIMKLKQTDDGKHHYFVHYLGWNSRWDKWSEEEELMPDGPESEELQKRLKDEIKQRQGAPKAAVRKSISGGGGGGSAGEGDGGGDGGAARKKPRIDTKAATEDDSELAQIKLPIPFTLKRQLVQDWENVTQEPRCLLPLPRARTAAHVLDAFIESKRGACTAAQLARFRELVDGLRLYFDRALPLILLYAHEREHHAAVVAHNKGRAASELYGAEHLLRLFTKLPALLAQTNLNSNEVGQLQAKLGEFLKYMQKNAGELFDGDYRVATEVMAELTEK
eukprot:TRINITY_DN840_c1_g1_i1.p1 TRINITY_DN840_c1_g1~~TRINITY_DN840_c1_g1_i1.p1  ORF type:complete len:335 (-),score=139.47 TRINITY_DN840_c1_g1_i1:76-999(-)